MSRHPEVKWAQRVNNVYITIVLPDAKNVNINLEPEGVLSFSANAGAENHFYELKLDLYDKVNVEESKTNIGARNILCVIEKLEKVWWKKLLRGDGKPPHYLKVDWDKWVDEDEDTGSGDLDLGGMDFSKFGGMEGMGDDMGDLDDSDDEDQEVEKADMVEAAKAVENTGGTSAEEKMDASPSS
uniref:Co-chaperone protein p23 n=1 Tax=Anthurium amnicola TaxID=1678845 RepID=A0A1D1YFE6_9ARAE